MALASGGGLVLPRDTAGRALERCASIIARWRELHAIVHALDHPIEDFRRVLPYRLAGSQHLGATDGLIPPVLPPTGVQLPDVLHWRAMEHFKHRALPTLSQSVVDHDGTRLQRGEGRWLRRVRASMMRGQVSINVPDEILRAYEIEERLTCYGDGQSGCVSPNRYGWRSTGTTEKLRAEREFFPMRVVREW